MKKAKRAFSILMCAALLLALLPTAALAAPAAQISVTITCKQSNGKTGELYYQLNGGDRTRVTDYDGDSHYTVTADGHSSITIWAVPSEGSYVNLSTSSVTPPPQGLDLNDLASRDGLTISFADGSSSYAVTVEFDNNNGQPGGGDTAPTPSGGAGDIQIQTENKQNGTIFYKINGGEWQEADNAVFTLHRDNELSGVENGATISFKATPNQDQSLDSDGDRFYYYNDTTGETNPLTNEERAALSSDDGYSITYDTNSYLVIHFAFAGPQEGGSGDGDGGGNSYDPDLDPDPAAENVDWDALKTALESYIFAYAGGSAEEMLNAVAAELSERRVGNLQYSLGEALGMGETSLKSVIAVTDNDGSPFAANDAINLPYYKLTITVPDHPDHFTLEDLKVYKLNDDKDFILASKANPQADTVYTVVAGSGVVNEGDKYYVVADFDPYDRDSLQGYGNGVMLNSLAADDVIEDEDIRGFHVTKEHCGSLGVSGSLPMETRLVVSRQADCVTLDFSDSAAPWAFSSVNAYTFHTENGAPQTASIFHSANTVTLNMMPFQNAKTITNVKVLELPASAVTVAGTTLTFHTKYDYIPLEITLSDTQNPVYLTLERKGLAINWSQVDGAPDSEHFGGDSEEYAAYAANWDESNTFAVAHGTDQFVRYKAESGEERVITATFYYDDPFTSGSSDDIVSHFTDSSFKHVSLFATITHQNGSVERKLIPAAQAITRSTARNATVTEGGGFRKDERQTCCYAGQGTNHFYDEFIVWSGSNSDFSDIASVNVIVFADGDTFGGVEVGSGNGVTWMNEAH